MWTTDTVAVCYVCIKDTVALSYVWTKDTVALALYCMDHRHCGTDLLTWENRRSHHSGYHNQATCTSCVDTTPCLWGHLTPMMRMTMRMMMSPCCCCCCRCSLGPNQTLWQNTKRPVIRQQQHKTLMSSVDKNSTQANKLSLLQCMLQASTTVGQTTGSWQWFIFYFSFRIVI